MDAQDIYMIVDSILLRKFEERDDFSITFGDDNKSYILGHDLVTKENVIINNVTLVDGFKNNLLSIRQLYD